MVMDFGPTLGMGVSFYLILCADRMGPDTDIGPGRIVAGFVREDVSGHFRLLREPRKRGHTARLAGAAVTSANNRKAAAESGQNRWSSPAKTAPSRPAGTTSEPSSL